MGIVYGHGIAAAAFAVALGLGAAVAREPAQGATFARAELIDANSRPAGHAVLTQVEQGVVIRVELKGLEPGWHALHIHQKGVCEPPFTSAGDHLNPDRSPHGFTGEGPHAGDLPNIYVNADGTVRVELFNPRIALGRSGDGVVEEAVGAAKRLAGTQPADIFRDGGAALVVHAKADDYRSDPAGAAGDRIACGVIRRK